MNKSLGFLACMLLVACGGGGGGGTPPTGITSVYTTPTPPSGANLAQQSVQRLDAQSGISGVQTARSVSGGGTTTFARGRALQAWMQHGGKAALFGTTRRYGIGPCSNSQEISITAGANNTQIAEIDVFYDAACVNIESKLVWTVTQSGANLIGPAVSTQYSSAGTITETDTMQVAFYYSGQTLTGFSLLVSSIVQNSVTVGQSAVGCTATSSTVISCGVADASNDSAGEVGANVDATVTTGSPETLSMQASAYQASSANALSIAAATFPFWSVSPSADQTQTVSITGTASASLISLTVTDSTNGGSLAISGSPTGSVSGTLTRTDTGAQVATFTIDGFGNGTLTYGSGTQVSIVNYAVQG